MNKFSFKQKLQQFLHSLLQRMARIVLGISLWAICSILLYFTPLFYPKPKPPTDFFRICIVEQGRATAILLKDYQQQPLCQGEMSSSEPENFTRLEFDGRSSLQTLTEYSDNMASPVIYTYQVNEQKQIQPISWRYAIALMRLMSVFWGMWLSMVLYAGLRKYLKRQGKAQWLYAHLKEK